MGIQYLKNEDGTFTVSSRSRPTQKWTVSADMKSCNCPKFRFILKKASPCHHMKVVLENEKDKITRFDPEKYTQPLKVGEFIDIYGDDEFDTLVANHEVVVHKNKVFLLE